MSPNVLINNSNDSLIVYLGDFKIVCDTLIRAYKHDLLYLLSTDVHLNQEYQPLSEEIWNSDNRISQSLLATSINEINMLCKHSKVKSYLFTECNDLILELDNDIFIEIIIDIQRVGYVFYQIYYLEQLVKQVVF